MKGAGGAAAGPVSPNPGDLRGVTVAPQTSREGFTAAHTRLGAGLYPVAASGLMFGDESAAALDVIGERVTAPTPQAVPPCGDATAK